jgi:hypothetical protein
MESDGIGCSLCVLLLASFDLDIDVSRLQLTVSVDFIEPNSSICFQCLQLGVFIDVIRFCLLGIYEF